MNTVSHQPSVVYPYVDPNRPAVYLYVDRHQHNFTCAAKLAVVFYLGLGIGGIGETAFTRSRSGLSAGGRGDELDRTIEAIRQVESAGNNHAVGDGGKALGAWQIHRAYWGEGTAVLGVDWPYSDARDARKARLVVRAYLTRWQRARKYPATPETWARLHVGGPQGPKRESSAPYWVKVKKAMEAK